MKPFRLGILTTHPIQYQAPFHAHLARQDDFDIEVLFCHDYGTKPQTSPWGVPNFKWDVQLLDGYRHTFLPNWAPERHKLSRPLNVSLPRVLRQRKFDALLQYGYQTPTFLLSALTASTPLILRGDSHLNGPRSDTTRRVKSLLLPSLLRKFAAFAAVGMANRAYYTHYGVPAERIFDAPHSVDNDWWKREALESAAKRPTILQSLGMPPDARVIGYAGQLIPLKHVDDIIDAFRIASATDPRAHLLVVGSGPSNDALRARARDLTRVVFTGFKNQSELPALYSVMNALVLASESETWGLVANEAMCVGVPIILSDRVGSKEDLVGGNGAGLIFPVGDIRALSECMSLSLTDEFHGKASVSALNTIERYSYEATANGLRAALNYLRRSPSNA